MGGMKKKKQKRGGATGGASSKKNLWKTRNSVGGGPFSGPSRVKSGKEKSLPALVGDMATGFILGGQKTSRVQSHVAPQRPEMKKDSHQITARTKKTTTQKRPGPKGWGDCKAKNETKKYKNLDPLCLVQKGLEGRTGRLQVSGGKKRGEGANGTDRLPMKVKIVRTRDGSGGGGGWGPGGTRHCGPKGEEWLKCGSGWPPTEVEHRGRWEHAPFNKKGFFW